MTVYTVTVTLCVSACLFSRSTGQASDGAKTACAKRCVCRVPVFILKVNRPSPSGLRGYYGNWRAPKGPGGPSQETLGRAYLHVAPYSLAQCFLSLQRIHGIREKQVFSSHRIFGSFVFTPKLPKIQTFFTPKKLCFHTTWCEKKNSHRVNLFHTNKISFTPIIFCIHTYHFFFTPCKHFSHHQIFIHTVNIFYSHLPFFSDISQITIFVFTPHNVF